MAVGGEPTGRASEAAVEAAQARILRWATEATAEETGSAQDVLDAAHDPALGLDRSVQLREVVEALDTWAAEEPRTPEEHDPAVYLERRFSGEGA